MCECCNDTMTIEKHEAHDTVELETNDYLAWLAREKQKINAIKSRAVQRRGRGLELHQDRYDYILQPELLLQNHGAGCRTDRPAEHPVQESMVLPSEVESGDRPCNFEGPELEKGF